jgi:hypothetical protein
LISVRHDVDVTDAVVGVVEPVVGVVEPVVEVVDEEVLVLPWWPYQPWADAGATVAVSDAATIASDATSAVAPPRYRCRLLRPCWVICPP